MKATTGMEVSLRADCCPLWSINQNEYLMLVRAQGISQSNVQIKVEGHALAVSLGKVIARMVKRDVALLVRGLSIGAALKADAG